MNPLNELLKFILDNKGVVRTEDTKQGRVLIIEAPPPEGGDNFYCAFKIDGLSRRDSDTYAEYLSPVLLALKRELGQIPSEV